MADPVIQLRGVSVRFGRQQVLRGIKAQTIAWRTGQTYEQRRQAERQQVLNTWLHDDHWRASDRFLAKGSQ